MSNAIKSIVLTPKIIKGIANQNQYAFNVNKKLKKPEIKQICEDIFNTKVISVNTSILPQKKYRPNFKRALVKFEKIKPYFHLFQNIYLSNRLKTKLKLLKNKNPLSDINSFEKKKKAKQAKIKKNNLAWLSTNELSKKDSNSIISQTYDYNSLMNVLNFPDSFVDHFIKQKVENNRYQNVIDFHDWVFLMKNRLNNSFKNASSSSQAINSELITGISLPLMNQEKINFPEENFSFKPLTQKDKTDFSLLQKTTTILKKKKKQSSSRKPISSSENSNRLVKKKKKKNFLLFTFSFPLNQKLKLKLPLIKNHQLSISTSKNKPKQTQEKKKTKSPILLYQEKLKSIFPQKRSQPKEAKRPNLFLDILSKTKINFSLPFSLPRSLPFFNIGSKLKTKPKLKLKPKKKAARWQLRLDQRKKSKTSKQVTEFLNTIRSIQIDNDQEKNNYAWYHEQVIKTNRQRLLKKIEKKRKKKKFIALIPSFLWPYIIEYGKKKKKTNLLKTTAKKQILSFSTEAINRKQNQNQLDIPEIKIKKLSTFVRPGKKEKTKTSNIGRFTPLLKTRLSAFTKEERVNTTLGKRKYKNLIQKKKKNIFESVKNFFGKILEPLRENRKKREQQKKSREIILDVARYKIVLWLRLMRNPKYFYNFDQVTNFEFFDFKNTNFRYLNNDDKENLLIMKALRRAEFFQKINNKIYDSTGISYWNFARLNSKKIRIQKMKDTENYQRRTLFRLKQRIVENDFFLRVFKMNPSDDLTMTDLWEITDMDKRDRYMNWSYIKTSWKRNNKTHSATASLQKRNRKKEVMLFIYAYKMHKKMNFRLKRKRQRLISTFGGRKNKIFSNTKFNLKTIVNDV